MCSSEAADKRSPRSLIFHELLTELGRRDIEHALLQDYTNLPPTPRSDVDLWVSPRDLASFSEALQSVSGKLGWTVHRPNVSPRLTSSYEGKYHMVLPMGDPVVVHIDCWSRPYWRGIPYIEPAMIGATRERGSLGYPTVSAGVEAAVGLLGRFLNLGRMPEAKREAILHRLEGAPHEFQSAVEGALGGDLAEQFLGLALEGRWGTLEDLVPTARRTLIWRAIRRRPLRQIRNWGRYVGGGLSNALRKDFGAFVALIGPDGSGKTTLAEALQTSEISDMLVKETHYFHTNIPVLPELEQIRESLGFLPDHVFPSTRGRPKDADPLPLLRAVLYPAFYAVNGFLSRPWLWKKRKQGGCLVLLDRYYFEYQIQRSFASCPDLLIEAGLRLVPTPDLVLFLRADPDTILARKPELPRRELEYQIKRCERVVDAAQNARTIDATKSIEETRKLATQAILETVPSVPRRG